MKNRAQFLIFAHRKTDVYGTDIRTSPRAEQFVRIAREALSKYEELRTILHCYCDIVFRTTVKRSIIEININPRA
jgi:hypothetical protein